MEVGQIVYLKSGGPAMTVDQVMDKAVSVKWFNGATASQANFPPEALTAEDPAEAIETAAAVRRTKVEAAAAAELAKAAP